MGRDSDCCPLKNPGAHPCPRSPTHQGTFWNSGRGLARLWVQVRQQGADLPPRTTNQALPGPAQDRPLNPHPCFPHSFVHSPTLASSKPAGPCPDRCWALGPFHPLISLLSPAMSQALGWGLLQSISLTPSSYPGRQTPLSHLFCRWGNRGSGR